ncbi:hypothetical protein RYX36_026017 [Vicia faba]
MRIKNEDESEERELEGNNDLSCRICGHVRTNNKGLEDKCDQWNKKAFPLVGLTQAYHQLNLEYPSTPAATHSRKLYALSLASYQLLQQESKGLKAVSQASSSS